VFHPGGRLSTAAGGGIDKPGGNLDNDGMTLNHLNMHPLEAILTWCHEAAPNPWYPSVFAQTSGIPRETLDPYLDELRLGGLVHLTDWVQGRGQGYALTPAGADLLQNPRSLERLRANGVPRLAAPPPLVRPQGEGALTSWDAGEKVRAALLHPSAPVVTACLALANVLVFLLGLVMAIRHQVPVEQYLGIKGDPDFEILSSIGAVNARQILDGQWWRLLTSCFVHIGLLHIAVNMYALYIFGPIVERMYGPWRFLLLYLVAGFAGSCTGMLFQPGQFVGNVFRLITLAGASGAICGLLGAFAAWTMFNRRHLPPRLVASWTRNALINAVLIAIVSALPGVSWAGHLGGGVVGFLAGGLLNYNRIGVGWRRWLALVGVLVVPGVCMAVLNRAQDFNATWAQLHKNYQRAIEEKRDSEAREKEREVMNDHLLPEITRIESKAGVARVSKQAAALAQQRAADRDRHEVQATIDGLAKARAGLLKAKELVRQAGPFRSSFVQEVEGALLEWIGTRVTLCETYQRCLKAGSRWSEGDRQKLEEQQRKVATAETRWEKYLKRG
jgi:membrane associated rhomboid family serine protease